MSEFRKRFPYPEKDILSSFNELFWSKQEEGWLKALKWVKAGIESPKGTKYDILLKRINEEINEVSNGK